MSTLPQTPGGRNAPRLSGIPTPGARSASGIPTPGRPRSTTNGQSSDPKPDFDAMRALSEAIRANDPAQHRLTPDVFAPPDASGRRSAAARPASNARASTSSTASNMSDRTSSYRPKTPASATTNSSFRSMQTPRSSIASSRPASRASDVFGRTPSRLGQSISSRPIEVGDLVRIDSIGVEGVLQFLGETEFKAGTWAGVELSGLYTGKGKNDGTVNGVRYFDCPPACGVFVAYSKLTRPDPRPSSVASSYDGRSTPSGRVTPSMYIGRTSSRLGSSQFKTPEPKISAGSRASKYVGLTAKQLSSSRESPRVGSASPTRSPTRAVTTSLTTPKAIKPSAIGLPGPRPRQSLAGSTLTPRPSATARNRVRSPVPDLPPPPFLTDSPSRIRAGFAKPITPTLSQTSSDTFVEELLPDGKSDDSRALEANARALQDRITRLISGSSHTSPDLQSNSPPSPQAIQPSKAAQTTQVEQLLSRVEELEAELERSRIAFVAAASTVAPVAPVIPLVPEAPSTEGILDSNEASVALADEKAAALTKIAELEAQLAAKEASTQEDRERLEVKLQEAEALASARAEFESKFHGASAQVSDLEFSVQQLRAENQSKSAKILEHTSSLASSTAALQALEEKLAKTTAELEGDKSDLASQVEELRLAGQETIALYEERLNNSEARRYDMEDTIRSLEDQIKAQSEPVSSAVLAARATTAAQIDNETLQEQVTHLQKKISTLEEQLDDARSAQERDEQAVIARISRFREGEAQFRKDLATAKQEKDELIKAETSARARVDEVTEALRESDMALEDARAEIETLRAELTSLEAIQSADGAVGDASSSDSVAKLKALLEEARLSAQKHHDVVNVNESLVAQITSLKTESGELEKRYRESISVSKEHQDKVAELGKLLDQRTADLEALRASSGSRESSSKHVNGRDDNLKEQVTGLKHVVQELTKENAALAATNKVLDSDNKMLLKETAELRDSLKELEETFEQSILREQRALDEKLDSDSSPSLQDISTLRQTVKDNQARHELEIDQLRKKIAEMEKKHTRTVHDLNKEIAELENLVEAKIYREDDLEREIERLKEKVSRRSAKASGESMLSRSKDRTHLSTESERSSVSQDTTVAEGSSCEICGEKGHDLLTCPRVFESVGNGDKTDKNLAPLNGEDLFCEDCESRGHTTANCPHSQDVF